MKRISLTQGQFATVDDEDFELLNQWTWWAVLSSSNTYSAKRLGVSMHRQILGLKPGDRRRAEHINRDKLDNRRSNLKIVSTRQSRLKDLCDKYV